MSVERIEQSVSQIAADFRCSGTIGQRFAAKVSIEDCWVWTGARSSNGYGRIGRGGKRGGSEYAHRVSYAAFKGPIPDGLPIDHLCRNKLCVNPDHLEAVTNLENVLRAVEATREQRRERTLARTHCKHGHELTPENTIWRKAGTIWRSCRTCQRRYKNRR